MPNRTFEIWEGFREAPSWSKLVMYIALLLIGVLTYFGAYFFLWNIAISAFIGVFVPILMLVFHSFSIRAKTEDTSKKGVALLWSVMAIIPISAFAFFGSHALGVHFKLQDPLNKELGCLSRNIEEAVSQYKTDKTTILTAHSSYTIADSEFLDEIQLITEKLKASYEPFSVGTVVKNTEIVPVKLELMYASLSEIDSLRTFTPNEINRKTLLNNVNSLKAGWSESNAIIIFLLIILSFTPVMVVEPPMRG